MIQIRVVLRQLFKKFIIILLVVLNIGGISYATNVFIPQKKYIAVVGDSYAGHFRDFIGIDGFAYYHFPIGGIQQPLNIAAMNEAIEGDHNYILLCTGANDFLLDTKLEVFEETLRTHIVNAEKHNKYIIFHTYMDFPKTAPFKSVRVTKSYDDILKKLALEYPNVFYIDMSGLSKGRFGAGDGLHYGKKFYEALAAKLVYLTDSIDDAMKLRLVPWIQVSNENMIAVAGDSYAGTFVHFEKDKKYNLVEFAHDGYTISQNTRLINSAIDSEAKYILISTSVNDFEKQTKRETFEDKMREFLNHALLNHKIVFLHSYMYYGAAKTNDIKIREYDDIIRKLAEEYQNTIYIDMHEYEQEAYQMGDKRHYGQEFNDKMYDVIDKVIEASK